MTDTTTNRIRQSGSPAEKRQAVLSQLITEMDTRAFSYRDCLILLEVPPGRHSERARSAGISDIDLDENRFTGRNILDAIHDRFMRRVDEARVRDIDDPNSTIFEEIADHFYDAITERGTVSIRTSHIGWGFGIFVTPGPFDRDKEVYQVGFPFKTKLDAARVIGDVLLTYLYETFGTTTPQDTQITKEEKTIIGGIVAALAASGFYLAEPGDHDKPMHQRALKNLGELRASRKEFARPYWYAEATWDDSLPADEARFKKMAKIARRWVARQFGAGLNPFDYPLGKVTKEDSVFWAAVRTEERRRTGLHLALAPSGTRFD